MNTSEHVADVLQRALDIAQESPDMSISLVARRELVKELHRFFNACIRKRQEMTAASADAAREKK